VLASHPEFALRRWWRAAFIVGEVSARL